MQVRIVLSLEISISFTHFPSIFATPLAREVDEMGRRLNAHNVFSKGKGGEEKGWGALVGSWVNPEKLTNDYDMICIPDLGVTK